MSEPLRTGLIELLRTYVNIFSWVPSNMLGIHESVGVHRLSVDPNKKHVWQKRRVFTPKRQKIIDDEIAKFLDAYVIFEIDYPK